MKGTLSLVNPGDWNSPVSTKLLKEWSSIKEEGISQKDLWFVHSCSAQKAVKRPRLVGFWDGSTQAFAGALYVVTMISKLHVNNEENLPDGDEADWDFDPHKHEFVSHILSAKAWITPLKAGLTVPRSEVSGLLLCSRLMARAVSLYSGGFGTTSCLGDSTCIISALDKNATSFNPFMHTRLSEILNLREKMGKKTNQEDVFHVASSDNIADICTRKESCLTEIGLGSSWQFGPSWLRQS